MDQFNLTAEALRKMMTLHVNVSDDPQSPEWEVQGYKTEDQSIEYNPDVSTVTDILGDTYTDVNKFERQASFEPNTLRMGSKLSQKLLTLERNDDLAKFSQFEVLIVYGFIGTAGSYAADMYPASTIYPNSLGGSSRVNMPFNIHLGGEKKKGTSSAIRGTATSPLTFTPTAP